MTWRYVTKSLPSQIIPVFIVAAVVLVVANSVPAAESTAKTFRRITIFPDGKLPVFATSRVVGSPEPPLPYSPQRMFPNLKLNFPVAIAHQPGSNRLWTITVDGPKGTTNIRRFIDTPDVSDTELLLAADDRVATDLLFHPDFERNGFVFIGHNRPISPEGEKYSRISRFKVNTQPPYEFDPKSEMTIIDWPSDGHNGVAMAFGLDGMFYVTTGDGTSDSDTNLRGQEMSHLTAKVLRIDIEHPTAGKPYAVPADNPFVGREKIAPETWAFGLRNPWRMTTDRRTGHIWVGNNGQDLWEQVYFLRKGDNYGWSVYEGSYPFHLNRDLGPAAHTKPTLEHHHSEARSLTGGIVFYGNNLPDLRGAYIYGDHSTGKIWGARHDGTNVTWHRELADTPFHISGFGTDSRGEMLIADYVGNGNGAFYTLSPAPPKTETQPFPRKLSETGLFQTVKGHVVEPALIPYDVKSPLWSDGAAKVRYVGIPGDAPKIEITNNRGWNFPNETVIVKSFSLEMTEGDTTSKRWIETRLMTKQQNEWIGYSYRWNDEQTDAALVEKEGIDVNFTIRTAEGTRQQNWHYPSRAECMVCHSRAAGFVLGLSTGQMNRPSVDPLGVVHAEDSHTQEISSEDKGTQIENQLSMLQRLGLLKLEKTPDEFERLSDPYDPHAKLEARAKSYLHANCAICHIDAGGGNSQMQLEFTTPLEKMKLIDAVPVHDKFGITDARLIAPGHPERSVLLNRMARRGRGQMPQLATAIVDESAVKMLTEWIAELGTRPMPKDEVGDANQNQTAFRRSLFDGTTLNGWTIENDCEVDIVDGCIRLKSGLGWLRSDYRLRDFELHIEWKALTPANYDAGIFIRSSNTGKPSPDSGYQVNLLDGKEGNIPNIAGAESKGLVKPSGEWNVFDLRVEGETASLKINGQPAWKASGLKDLDGWLGIQVEVPSGGQFLLRNVEVTEIGYQPLFNGRDLTGWEGVGGASEECWSVIDGVLTCSGKKGPWLRSAAEYDDFNLRLEYLVSNGGNSGVYVRVPRDGNHHRDNETQPAAGFEVQILDDTAPAHAKLKDFQYSASIYDFAGADPRNSRPLGEWNSLEINCVGQKITTWHNGVCVTNISDKEIPSLALRSIKGFLGLQNHSTVVGLRNIRIGKPVNPPTDKGQN
jgi:uncharacterized repeat protein (TIGR03806 family)